MSAPLYRKPTYVDLDAAAGVHSPGPPYHERAAPLIEGYAADVSRWYVVDVGAGFQDQQPHGVEWMRPFRERMITVTATPAVVLARLQQAQQDGRTLEGLIDQEFSPVRRVFYDMARHRVENIGDADQHARELAARISYVMEGAKS